MKPISFCLAILFTLMLLSCGEKEPQATQNASPNIIYILADDLGYGDLGVYGQQKIETPNIDALAREGMLFKQHYSSAPVCAPARYMLLTGKHSGRAYIRGNDEWRERGPVWDYKEMIRDSTLEGQRPVPADTRMFPQQLQKLGYATGLFGKWGLGAPHTDAIPTKMGFDTFFGYNCQRQAHTYYPVHLYEDDHRVYLRNDTVPPNTKLPPGADPALAESYRPFNQADYAPDHIFKALTNFVDKNKSQPFFLYWATPIPHVALQAPQSWVDYYVDKFGEEEPYLGEMGYFPHPNPRAAYAAMISYLDENVGKLVAQLKEQGLYDNTLIIFTSDNGPSFAGGADPEWFNSGGPLSEGYGRGKGFVYEGGIRVPMIASWPGRIQPGSKTELPSAHYDLAATLAELLDFSWEDTDGISFLPTLLGEEESQPKHDFLYWEFPEYGGQIAIRMGEWKLIRQHLKDKEPPTLELYNLETDPLETTNLAEEQPEILQQMAAVFEREHQKPEQESFLIPPLENGLMAME